MPQQPQQPRDSLSGLRGGPTGTSAPAPPARTSLGNVGTSVMGERRFRWRLQMLLVPGSARALRPQAGAS